MSPTDARHPRGRAVPGGRAGTGFWLIAAAFLTAMASTTLQTPAHAVPGQLTSKTAASPHECPRPGTRTEADPPDRCRRARARLTGLSGRGAVPGADYPRKGQS
jgi:hypothetical protein